jgi:RNA polymerase subunit RPABC4/transcription elongation factor Spt4
VFKGRVHIFDAEKSELAENMGINKDGEFAIKSK